MSRIDKEQIRQRADLHAFYLRECGQLGNAKANGDCMTRCVFHDDANASLCVNIKDGSFKCFGCGLGGDVFKFVQQLYGLSFADAIVYVGGDHGEHPAPVQRKKPTQQKRKPGLPKAPVDLKNPSYIYPYCDVDGLIIYYVFRWDKPGHEKNVMPGYYNEEGEIVLGMPKGVKKTLYSLYRVDDYIDPQGRVYQKNPLDEHGRVIWPPSGERVNLSVTASTTVFLVEGEKCCEALLALGMCATTSGSATTWKAEFAELLRGKNVIVIPDADSPGEQYAQQAARDLAGVAESVRILRLEGLSAGEDVGDWITARGCI
ncbi:MAG: CHC2 zinc finger domain-containing protein [Desulfovibrionaceae bacterium]|nr:CHC2 zinc finger domain-containing protein [Desulfovibrionaceae bacterium]